MAVCKPGHKFRLMPESRLASRKSGFFATPRACLKIQSGSERAVSRILSSPAQCAGGEDHLSKRPVPETELGISKVQYPAILSLGAGHSAVSYLALHRTGFTVPPRLLSERWALTPPFHPYPRSCLPRRYIFCGTFRRVTPPSR